jgi:predicted dehydrogenase
MIDMALWLVGDVENVQAHLATFIKRSSPNGQEFTPANDSALITVEFTNGGHGTIQASAVAYMSDRIMQQQVRLYGDTGTLQVNVLFSGSNRDTIIQGAKHHEEQFQNIVVPSKYWSGLDAPIFDGNQVQQLFCKQPIGPRLFIDAVLEGKEVTPNFFDGLKAQAVVDAVLTSHQTKQRVAISNLR